MSEQSASSQLMSYFLLKFAERKDDPHGALSAVGDTLNLAAYTIDCLNDELASAQRHTELAENAWLRETSGNSPAAVTLTPDERKAVTRAIHVAEEFHDSKLIATLRGLLERTGGEMA